MDLLSSARGSRLHRCSFYIPYVLKERFLQSLEPSSELG